MRLDEPRTIKRLQLGVALLCISVTIACPIAIAEHKGSSSMNAKSNCGKTALERSRCMIMAILADVEATYPHVGGGGITEIKMIASDTFRVSISQEERIDIITYALHLDDNGHVRIVDRSEDTKDRSK